MPSVEEHLGCFMFLPARNKAAMNSAEDVPCGIVEHLRVYAWEW